MGTSHVALLPYLKHLEELKILKSESKGRNKHYTLNKENILTKYYLATTEDFVIDYLEHNFLAKKLAQHISNIDISSPLILFGSYAKGYATGRATLTSSESGKLTKTNDPHKKS